ncbi:MAG: helix-turn-helix transcriptional regulator [Solobacterium sp.]|nr:helix-turn-helix transcriptional regulator [Erysipelotrichaceae bacterium]MBQ9153953.1 helix-turn-helix transcriptional regulator [Solobacterium sp.]
MASKDHSLDEKIVDAARNEFLEVGYRNASMRKIAARAGITTGALYTRYENKDVLFASLVYETGMLFEKEFSALKPEHYQIAIREGKFSQLSAHEAGRLLDIIYSHHDECYLLFCCSEGSTAEKYYPLLVKNKARAIARYMNAAGNPVTRDTVEMLTAAQYSYFVEVLRRKYTREQAGELFRNVLKFCDAGWLALVQ